MTSIKTMQAKMPKPDTAALAKQHFLIRDAVHSDFERIQAIYAHHELHSTATFEEEPPSTELMLSRWQAILQDKLPYLVAVINEEVVGYAYASIYRPRVAYRYTLEDSIYLSGRHTGKGLGSALLSALITRCEQGPWRQMIAVIAGHDKHQSIGLHRSLGFVHAGTQAATGYKFQQWIDVIFMQRSLGQGSSTAPDPGT